jgi:predicted enzyme related to lactoylglutathione lyase
MSDVLFVGVPVDRFDEAVEWYTRLFGRAPDLPAHAEEVMWRIADGGWLYVLREPERSGHAIVSIAVADLDAALAELADRGLGPTGMEQVGQSGRKATFHDPEGNLVSLLEVAAG